MKQKHIYICTACNATTHQWQGQCPKCGQWNSLIQKAVSAKKAKPAYDARVHTESATLKPLQDIKTTYDTATFSSGQEALDALLGKGLIPGATILLAGEPGIGKSTLLLQLVGYLTRTGKQAVYVSAEESLPQLQARANRLGLLCPELLAMSTTKADDILAVLESTTPPALMVVDSVQTFTSSEVDGLPGSVSQVRFIATALTELAKIRGVTLILVGHITKDGQIAGPKLLEHMVDTVLSLEGERKHLFRILRVMKNRFGPAHEILLFEMTGKGMEMVTDPSTFFLQDRDPNLSGTCLCMAVSGQRAYAVEIQALVSKTVLAIPRRTALGFDANRLHLLLAVMEKKLHLNLSVFDIYTKIGGGLKLTDPGLDAGIVAAVLSSFYDTPLPKRAVVWGEVDLNGQIRPITFHDVRMKQATKLGYNPILHPTDVKNISTFQQKLFGKK